MAKRSGSTVSPGRLNLGILLAVTALVAGCKLNVVSPPGGDVTSSSLTCAGGTVCEVTITDESYSDTFTATPRNGYEFVKWLKADGFFCGDTSAPCTVQMPADAKLAADVVALFATGYIMPIYKEVGDTDDDGMRNELDPDDDNDGIVDGDDSCPLNTNTPCALISAADTVTANGRVWAQVDLFTNVSWNQINAVCPQGVCARNALLNGYDLTGWTWANGDDVAALLNGYGVLPPLTYPSPSESLDSTWAPAFFGAGWRATHVSGPGSLISLYVTALCADSIDIGNYIYPSVSVFADRSLGQTDYASLGWVEGIGTETVSNRLGAFFYRGP